MKRVTRHLFTLCSATSLLLCAALCVLWVRSNWEADVFARSVTVPDPASSGLHVLREDSVESEDGTVRWTRALRPPPDPTPIQREVELMWFPLLSSRVSPQPSFAWESQPGYLLIIVPHWALVLGTLPLPAAYLWSASRRRRWPVGHCRHCGYDLRASPERCPECGRPAARKEGV